MDPTSHTWPATLEKLWVGFNYKHGLEILGALVHEGFKIGSGERHLLSHLPMVSRMTQLTLKCVSAEQLGFRRMPNDLNKMYRRAFQQKLSLCPPELGPLLMLQYSKLPPKEARFLLGMTPLVDTDGSQRIFVAQRSDGGLWTQTVGGPNAVAPGIGDPWLFVADKEL